MKFSKLEARMFITNLKNISTGNPIQVECMNQSKMLRLLPKVIIVSKTIPKIPKIKDGELK